MKKIKICVLMACLIMCVSSVTLAANFYDVKGTKYEGVVDRVAKLGIINGVSENTFAPNKSITRAELAKMIVFTRGLKDYADTSGLKANFSDTNGHWAESYIATAEDLGLLNGYSDGTFRPDAEVSYAEVVAIILRGLGYVNIDETSGSTWYSGYIKRMFEINLNKGVDVYTSYEEPAKRGDVAILWWNMLVSTKWVAKSEWEVSGLYYTYSNKTQMEVLFPDYRVVTGRVGSIFDTGSGENIGVEINYKEYETDSDVPIYSKGATAVGVLDKESDHIYGFTIDEDLEDHKVVSGPIFYLEEQGYNLRKSKNESVYGSKIKASYAYLLVSKETGEILRSVLIDASNSNYVEKIEVSTKKKDPDDEESDDTRAVYLNESEDPFIENAENAIVIKNGKRVEWDTIEEGSVITELIPNELYTFEKTIIDGEITDYSDLRDELWIDSDKYIVADNCFYVKMGTTVSEEDDSLKTFSYSAHMDKEELEKLLPRDIEVYLNMAEEICFIKFGKYRTTNLIEKYDNFDNKFFYLTSLSYRSGDDLMNIGGRSLSGNSLKYFVPFSEDFSVGDFVMVSEIEGKNAENVELINGDIMYEEDDISIIYDCDAEFYNNAFGEYIIVDDSVIFRVNKYYENNSNRKIETCTITELSSIYQVKDLEKYKVNLFCNNDMEIDIVFLERELDRTNYPVGRVLEIRNVKNEDDDKENNRNEIIIPIVHAKIATIGGKSEIYEVLSGDCAVGELITYDGGEGSEDTVTRIKIKERFQMKFLGYEKDVVIESFDKNLKCAKIKNNSEDLNLLDSTFTFNNKEIDLLDYKYILSEVKRDTTTGEWKFISGKFYEKEDLMLKPGDRIAFGELNGIAVIYRGWSE